MRLIQVLALCAAFALLVSGVGLGGYVLSKRISSVPCYGCMGLNPKFTPFKGFSTENISHPEWVIDTLKDDKIVFIFLWGEYCSPCEAQWDDMKSAGIVKGEESNGEISEKYEKDINLFSLYGGDPKGDEATNIYNSDKSTPPSVPTTVIITLIKDNETNEVKIGWYSFKGYEYSNPTMSYLKNVIESAVYHYDENRSQWVI